MRWIPFHLVVFLALLVPILQSKSTNHVPQIDIEPLSLIGWIRNPRQNQVPSQNRRPPTLSLPVPDPVVVSTSSISVSRPSRVKRVKKRQVQLAYATAGQSSSADGSQAVYYTATPQAYSLTQDANGLIYATSSPMTVLIPQNQAQTNSKFVSRSGESVAEHSGPVSIAAPYQVNPSQPKVSIVSHADPYTQQSAKKHEKSQQLQPEQAQLLLQSIIKQQALQQTQQQRLQFPQHDPSIAASQSEVSHPESSILVSASNVPTGQAGGQMLQIPQEGAFQVQAIYQTPANGQQVHAIYQSPSVGQQVQAIYQSPSVGQQVQAIYQSPANEHQVQAVYQNHPNAQHVQTVYQTPATSQHQFLMQKAVPVAPASDEDTNPHPVQHPQHVHMQSQQQQPNFVIRHQTYVAGPGGQMFTVPIPVPVQPNASTESQENHEASSVEQNQHQPNSREDSGEAKKNGEPKKGKLPVKQGPWNLFMRRVMDAFSVRGDTKQRVETNIALPLLASTGVFFGLGALAAGWYLSNTNREIGILRRTGKPVQPGTPNIKRVRRGAPPHIPEVDQATFFQNIIQQAIEKQQQLHEEEPTDIVPNHHNHPGSPQTTSSGTYNRRKPQNRNDWHPDEGTSSNSKVGLPPMQKKSWLGSKAFANFAKVAIPAIVLGGAVIAIGVLIFGWYITGSNREIAFLEPSAYSRKKRDLTTTAFTDGWVQRVLTSIHDNPYDEEQKGFDLDSSKGSLEYHANLSDAVVAVSLAVVAFFSLMGILIAWWLSENQHFGNGGVGTELGGWGRGGTGLRTRRSLETNAMGQSSNPSFLESLLTNLETSSSKLWEEVRNQGWEETPCAKKIFCQLMSSQNHDTIRAMEKRLITFVSMLPEKLSDEIILSLGEMMISIDKRDCSAYTCGHGLPIVSDHSPRR